LTAVKRKATRKRAAKKGAKGPTVGMEVRYAGKVWTIAGMEKDPHNFGSFVDLVRHDDEGKYEARIHTAQMKPDTTGGRTVPDEAPFQTGSRHAGDPRFPLTPEFEDRHRRFNQLIDVAAEQIFKRSNWKSKLGWSGLPEEKKAQLRRLVRAEWTASGDKIKSPPGVTRAVIRTAAPCPADLQEWLTANG
jgi:hypothetical protein